MTQKPFDVADMPSPPMPRGFDPKHQPDENIGWSGSRREVEYPVSALIWRWPGERKAQLRAFDDWHDIAMQIVHRSGSSFRLMAVYRKVIRWNEGCIWSSDIELAIEAGHCNWKTISREVGLHRKLGIIDVELGWRMVTGKKLRTRTIRLAVPAALDSAISVRDLVDQTVTSGPHETPNHTVSSGPNHTVTSGPITLVTPDSGASRYDPA